MERILCAHCSLNLNAAMPISITPRPEYWDEIVGKDIQLPRGHSIKPFRTPFEIPCGSEWFALVAYHFLDKVWYKEPNGRPFNPWAITFVDGTAVCGDHQIITLQEPNRYRSTRYR